MKKDETLKSLEAAKLEIIRLVDKAKLLINGGEKEDEFLPIEQRKSKFGIWFYSDGQKLKALSNNPLECMTNIEQLHARLHETYLEIYNMCFLQEESGSFFSKIFKPKQKLLNDFEKKAIKEDFVFLEDTANKLLEEVKRLERRLVAVSEEKIDTLV